MSNIRKYIGLAAATAGFWSVTILVLLLTNPSWLGPYGVTLWFLTLFLSIGASSTGLLLLAKWFIYKKTTTSKGFWASAREGLLFSGWVVMLLALRSLRQYSLRDAILLLILFGLIEAYLYLNL